MFLSAKDPILPGLRHVSGMPRRVIGVLPVTRMHIGYRLGRKLTFDAAILKLAGGAEANKMLTLP